MGKKSYQYLGQRAWKVAQYLLLLLPLYSIGISLRPAVAGSPTFTPAANSSLAQSVPLTYQVVQKGSQGSPTTNLLVPNGGTIELNAEQQDFNNSTKVITARGKVVVRFNKAILRADRLRVNLKTKIAVAEGNVSLLRGKQILYGTQFEYNFEADQGSILEARGDIYQPTLVTDLNVVPKKSTTSVPAGEKRFPEPLLSDRLLNDQPVTTIQNTSTTGITVGSERDIEYQPTLKPKGTITRLRFQADKVDFVGEQVTAEKIRITNDPFSPPEIQIKADQAQFKTVNSEEDEVTTKNGQVSLENNINLPLPRDRYVLNKLGKDANPFGFGIDGTDRGGIYAEQKTYPIFNSKVRLTVIPQYFIQRAITGFKFFDPSVFGLVTNLEANVGPETTVQASASLAGFTTQDLNNNLRAKASVKQNVSLFSYPHILTGEAVYREQIFNGSLGYQDVQSSIGGVLTSPKIPVGTTGINLDYQIGAQIINANTDRPKLLGSNTSPGLVTLNRYQVAANLDKSFRLWEGKSLAADNPEAYNYSPSPVVPYLQLNTGIKGAYSSYSSGDSQSSIGYNLGIQGQFGNFSKSSFDYTGFNLNYAQQFLNNGSPFLFDRIVDSRTLSAGINQQIIGPFKLGIQTSLNLDTGQEISTDYYLEYSRRSYNFVIRYNPALQLGSIGFRLNDFNWDGVTPKF